MAFSLGNAYGRIDLDAGGALTSIAKTQGGLLGLGGSFVSGAAKATAFGVAVTAVAAPVLAVGGAIGGLTSIISSSTEKAAGLEAQLSNIKAVSGASTQEMAQLKEVITDLGVNPNLKVSATEAADAMGMLSRNGLALEEIMGGAAEATILLANATGADFSPAADVATDVMTIFGIEAENMMAAVNGITGVVNNSKFDFDDYRLAIAQGGAAAKAAGVSFDEFNTVIAGTSSMFASGSDAGTSYKAFLSRLIPTSKEAAAIMNKLGLEFFDAQGNLKDMGDIAGMLNEKLNEEFQMTVQLGGATEDMAKAAEKAQDKLPGLTTKVAEQQAKLSILQKELDGAIDKYGEGSVQADKKRLAIQKLTNDIDENQGKIAGHQEALRAMADATTETISQTTKLTEEQRNNTLSTLFGADAMRTAAGLAALGADGYRELNEAMAETDAADSAATRMDNLAGDMEILDGVIESLQIKIGDRFVGLKRTLVQNLTQLLSGNEDAIVTFFNAIGDGVEGAIDMVGPALDTIIAQIGLFTDNFQTGFAFGDGGLEGTLRGLEQGLAGIISPEAMDFVYLITDGIRGLVEVTPGAVSSIKNLATEILAAFNEGGLAGVAEAFWSWANGENGIEATAPDILNGIADLIIELLVNQIPKILEAMREYGVAFWTWIDEVAIPQTGEMMGNLIQAISDWAQSPEGQEKLRLIGHGLAVVLITGMKNALISTELMMGVFTSLITTLVNLLPTMAEAYISIGQSIATSIFSGIYSFITGEEPSKEITDLFGTMWRGVMTTLMTVLLPPLGIAFALAQFDSIRDKIAELDFAAIGRAIIDGIASGLSNASAIVDAAKDAARQALDSAKAWLYSNSPSKRAADEVGLPISQGIAVGINKGVGEVNRAALGSIQSSFKSVKAGLATGVPGVKSAVQDTVQLPPLASQTPALAGAAVGNSLTNSVGKIEIIIQAADSPKETAVAVKDELSSLFDLAQAGAV